MSLELLTVGGLVSVWGGGIAAGFVVNTILSLVLGGICRLLGRDVSGQI